MTEREERVTDDGLSTEIKGLRSDAERKNACVELVRDVFRDSEIVQVQLTNFESWQKLLPETAKGLPFDKDSTLDLIIIVGPNSARDESVWINGADHNEKSGNEDDDEDVITEPPSYCDVKFYIDSSADSVFEIDDERHDAMLSLFLDDRNPELWTFAEEKKDTFIERKSSGRKGNTQRLKMFAEILTIAKARLESRI